MSMSSGGSADSLDSISLSTELVEQFTKAANLIKTTDSRLRVISHYDADGLTAGTVICATLIRLNKQFQVSLRHNLDPNSEIFSDLEKAGNCLKIFSDLGSGRLDEIEELDGNNIILDHHKPIRDTKKGSIVHINTHLFGINGSNELSASTLAFLLSIHVTPRNWDLIDLALAGAIGDKQHKNGFKGVNLQLVQEAVKRGILEERTELKISGKTVTEAVLNSTDPYFVGLTSNESAIKKLLASLEIDPEQSLDKLAKDSSKQLVSYLILKLLEQGIPPEDAQDVITTRYYNIADHIELEELSHIINSCGRMDQMGLGVAAGLGDAPAMERAKQLRFEYKQKILEGLKKLTKDGPKELENIQYFYEPITKFAGTFAGIGMMYFFNQDKPVIALTKTDEDIKISGRGTNRLVDQGLDLAIIFSSITPELNGTGGGHQIAAGATIPLESEKKFLETVDKLVGEQLKINNEIDDNKDKN